MVGFERPLDVTATTDTDVPVDERTHPDYDYVITISGGEFEQPSPTGETIPETWYLDLKDAPNIVQPQNEARVPLVVRPRGEESGLITLTEVTGIDGERWSVTLGLYSGNEDLPTSVKIVPRVRFNGKRQGLDRASTPLEIKEEPTDVTTEEESDDEDDDGEDTTAEDTPLPASSTPPSSGVSPTGVPFPYDPPEDCRPDVRVYVDGDRVPVVDESLEMYVRKDGPLDVMTVADVYIPNVLNNNGEFAALLDPYAPVDIEIWDSHNEQFRLVHRGFLKGAGSAAGKTNKIRMRVGDFAQLLSEIPARQTFDQSATADDFIRYALTAFDNALPTSVSVTGEYDDTSSIKLVERSLIESGTGTRDAIVPSPQAFAIGDLGDTLGIGHANYTANRSTLADVLSDVREYTSITFEFRPSGSEEISLRAKEIGTRPTFNSNNVSSDGVRILENDALSEVQPVNTLVMRGKAGGKVFDIPNTDWSVEAPKQVSDGQYPHVVVEHTPSVERANQRLAVEATSEASSLDTAITQAKKTLKQRLDASSGGQITCELDPRLRPYQTFQAKPTCNSGLNPYSFEIHDVTHETPVDARSQTQLTVGVSANWRDINVVGELTGLRSVGETAGEDPSSDAPLPGEQTTGLGPGSP